MNKKARDAGIRSPAVVYGLGGVLDLEQPTIGRVGRHGQIVSRSNAAHLLYLHRTPPLFLSLRFSGANGGGQQQQLCRSPPLFLAREAAPWGKNFGGGVEGGGIGNTRFGSEPISKPTILH